MRAATLAIVLGTALVTTWFASACLVDRKSDALACTKSSECSNSRACVSGFCVTDSDCPSACDSCDGTVKPPTCHVSSTAGMSFTCPSGVACTIDCATAGACGDITCNNDSICTIACASGSACGAVTCKSSCACDVTCPAGDCGTISCPKTGSRYCTASGSDGQECESSPSNCNHC